MNGNGRAHHRVAVTGIGVITPIGIGVREFWEATLAGKIGTK
jgi:3-oxoacyl-(acyl-carrier-protein) synthase